MPIDVELGHRAQALLIALRERFWASAPESFPDEKPIDSGHKVKPEDDEKDDYKITAKFVGALMILLTATFLSSLDYGAIGNVVGTISGELGGNSSQSEWIGNGYALGSAVFQLPISTLSDIFGRRALVMATMALFMIGSIVCGTAQNMSAMIAGRVIQGAGAAGNFVLPEVVLADLVPLRLRGMYYAVLMFVWCVGNAVGPIIAGAFAEYSTWRWIFYLNLPISGFALVLSPFVVKLKHKNDNWKKQLARVDYIGAALVVSSSTSLLLGLSRADSSKDTTWSSWSVILPIVLGAVGLIATGFYELYATVDYPMFNVRVFGNVTAAVCFAQNVLQGMITMASIYYLPTFFQGAKGFGQLMAGVAILPISLIGPPASLLVGWIIMKTGHYQAANYILWGVSVTGVALLTLIGPNMGIAGLMCIQIPASIGINCLYATLSITVNASNPPHLWTDSTAMMSFCRQIGDTLGVAIGGAVFASQMKQRLADLSSQGIVDASETSNSLAIVASIRKLEAGSVKDALINALTGSMHTLFIVLAIFSAVALVSCLLQKEYSLDQRYEAKQGVAD